MLLTVPVGLGEVPTKGNVSGLERETRNPQESWGARTCAGACFWQT